MKRELLSQINNLHLALQKADDHDDFELQDKFAYLEREVGRFDNYLNENVALEHQGFREQVFKEFENLNANLNKLTNYPTAKLTQRIVFQISLRTLD